MISIESAPTALVSCGIGVWSTACINAWVTANPTVAMFYVALGGAVGGLLLNAFGVAINTYLKFYPRERRASAGIDQRKNKHDRRHD